GCPAAYCTRSMTPSRPLTVAFFPEGAFGPTNNCAGIGSVLRRRGHRVVFIVEESFAETLQAKGFEERLMRLTPKPEAAEDPDLPPVFSGYSSADRSGWEEFREEYRRVHMPLWSDFDQFVTAHGAPHLADLEFMHESPDLNLYLYPVEADYRRSRPLPPTWH